jgi:hypothetical protein
MSKVKFTMSNVAFFTNHIGRYKCRGRHDRMVVGFTTTYAISAYHHWSFPFESCSWRGALDTTLCDKVCQWLPTGWWFSPGTLVSSTDKTDCHDIIEILLKLVFNTILHKPVIIDYFRMWRNVSNSHMSKTHLKIQGQMYWRSRWQCCQQVDWWYIYIVYCQDKDQGNMESELLLLLL